MVWYSSTLYKPHCVFFKSTGLQILVLRPALSNSTPGRKTSKRSGWVMLSSGLDFHTPGFNIASTLRLSKYDPHLNLQEPHKMHELVCSTIRFQTDSGSSPGSKTNCQSLQVVFCFGRETLAFLFASFFFVSSNYPGGSGGLVLRLAKVPEVLRVPSHCPLFPNTLAPHKSETEPAFHCSTTPPPLLSTRLPVLIAPRMM